MDRERQSHNQTFWGCGRKPNAAPLWPRRFNTDYADNTDEAESPHPIREIREICGFHLFLKRKRRYLVHSCFHGRPASTHRAKTHFSTK